MLIRLLRAATPSERHRLADFLAQPRAQRRPADLEWIRARMDAYGCLEHAQQVAHALDGAALHEFAIAFDAVPESRDRRFIEALAAWVLERS
jgi:geranylgeranyl diphosphate synthase type II